MASSTRSPFRIVNDLALSGNRLIDTREIYRGNYDIATVGYRDLLIRAGADVAGGATNDGGTLRLLSGFSASTKGSIQLFIPDDANNSYTNKYGIEILGSLVINLKTTANVNITAATTAIIGLATVSSDLTVAGKIDSNTAAFSLLSTPATSITFGAAAPVINMALSGASTVDIKGTTAGGTTTTGALVVRGGVGIVGQAVIGLAASVGGNLTVTGTIDSSTAIFSLLATPATSITFGTAAATLNIGVSTVATQQVNIASGATGTAKTVNIGTSAIAGTTAVTLGSVTSGTVTLRGATLNLGTDNGVATTATIGAAITANTLKIASVAAGTINITTDVTAGGIANFLASLTTSTLNLASGITTGIVNIATAGASTINLGGAAAVVYVGTSSGSIATSTAASTANVFNTNATTINAFGGATGTTNLGNAASGIFNNNSLTVTHPNATSFTAVAATTLDISSAPTTATTINIGTGATSSAATRTISIGLNAAAGSISNVYIGSTLGTPNTYLNGNITLGDAAAKTVTLTGTIASTGIKMFDASGDTYSILPGVATGAVSITLPTVTGKNIALTSNTTGLVALVDGGTNSALTASKGGIVFSDTAGLAILATPAAAGQVLVSGGTGNNPQWSGGAFTVANGQSFNLSNGLVTLTNGNAGIASTLTIPVGATTFPGSVVAGDILYANGAGTYTRLAGPNTTGYVLVSNTNASGPYWSNTVPMDTLTLTGDLVVNGGDITTNQATFRMFNSMATALTMQAFTGSSLILGLTGATSHTSTLYSNITIGEVANTRTVNLYGTLNYGGTSGYSISYNSSTSTMDFIKL